MFNEFDQLVKKLQGCSTDCNPKYRLQAKYSILFVGSYSVCSIEGDVIFTSMNRFYQRVNIIDPDPKINSKAGYQGTVFVGVSFKDQKDITVTCNKKLY
jgi:hypothetical protein